MEGYSIPYDYDKLRNNITADKVKYKISVMNSCRYPALCTVYNGTCTTCIFSSRTDVPTLVQFLVDHWCITKGQGLDLLLSFGSSNKE